MTSPRKLRSFLQKSTKKLLRVASLATAVALAATPALAARPVVLELFTSQSCSSCPPADALLAELAATGTDVLPLDFHVDYWNYLSWVDKFASPEATARQRAYAASLGAEVYTPQLIIHGRYQAVGSDRDAVTAAIARARAEAAAGPDLALTTAGGQLAIELGAGAGPAKVVVVGYDRRHTTQVKAGENGGRTLTEANVVRAFNIVGTWQGTADHLTVPRPAGETAAVLLQAADGRILAAASLDPVPPSAI